jgi:hypothetical protein
MMWGIFSDRKTLIFFLFNLEIYTEEKKFQLSSHLINADVLTLYNGGTERQT